MRQFKGMIWVLLGVLVLASTAAVMLDNLKFSVKKESDGKWYVVDERNQHVPVRAKGRDIVIWTADGSDMTFTFPQNSNFIFEKEDGSPVPPKYVEEVKNGKKLILKVKNNAPKGSYEYEVYVAIDDTVALGSSPPVIIIQ